MSQSTTKRCIGLLAHVDAGKTTLALSLLLPAGGNDAAAHSALPLLDYYPAERERGITVFSKGARLHLDNSREIILLDTPGHVDFAPETERTLTVLDAAILLVSAPDGLQGHTKTLWSLLRRAGVPTIIFVNKTDLPCPPAENILSTLRAGLSPAVCPLSLPGETAQERQERLALQNDVWMEKVLGGGVITEDDLRDAFASCTFFPVVFGAASRGDGVADLRRLLDDWVPYPAVEAEQAAAGEVYQIRRTDDAIRLTLCRVTAGSFAVRDEVPYRDREGRLHRDKITQIRLYDGRRFVTADKAEAGEVCALLGLDATYAGGGLGDACDESADPKLQPMLCYQLTLPAGVSPDAVWPELVRLGEEEPTLSVARAESGGIALRLMGKVQNEIMTRVISERLGMPVSFDRGEILYRETVTAPVYGIGHFEPLRHYAEVHLLLEPLPRGRGVICESAADENNLPRKWQRAVLDVLYDADKRGVLVGDPLTDVKITLVAAAINLKHTDGGDIREATLRALRHALMRAKVGGLCQLLEPTLAFSLTVPNACAGRALCDLQAAGAAYEAPTVNGDATVITGHGPFAALHEYAAEVAAYTHGKGDYSASGDGFSPCRDSDAVITVRGYNPEADLLRPPHSIFCAHGAGFLVPWGEVENYAHIKGGGNGELLPLPTAATYSLRRDCLPEGGLTGGGQATRPTENGGTPSTACGRSPSLPEGGLEKTFHHTGIPTVSPLPQRQKLAAAYALSDEEVEAIMQRTFGPIKRRQYKTGDMTVNGQKTARRREAKPGRLLIDGYNLLFADEDLAKEAEIDLERARGLLCGILSDYAAYTHADLTVAFDAYRVPENDGREEQRGGITVVYTKTGQTADAWLESKAHELGPDYDVTMVTSDRLVQFSALHAGLLRKSSREFWGETNKISEEIRDFIRKLNAKSV